MLSPAIGLSCHRRSRNCFRKLDAGVEASGPHDFAVRKHAPSSEAPPASTASRPASVTIAIRPCEGWDGKGYRFDLGQRRREIFLERGLDWGNQIDPAQQIPLCAQAAQPGWRQRIGARRGPRPANRRNVSFHDQDRTVRELYNSIGSAANQSVVER